jgi:hypothetical protein
MQFGSSKDNFPYFTRLNPYVAHCSTDSIPWVHHSRKEGSLDYDRGFVHLQIHMKFDTNIHCQQSARKLRDRRRNGETKLLCVGSVYRERG